MDASKYAYAFVLTQHSDGTDHPITYVSSLFRGSQLNWATLTKEAYAIYMSVKKLSFYIDTVKITVKSDHLPLKKFLEKNTMNSKVNNWAVELEAQNITFEYIPGIWNTLADTLSRLIEMDEDIKLQPEEEGKEFGYFPFEGITPSNNTGDRRGHRVQNWQHQHTSQHTDPVQVDIEITLPMKEEKLNQATRVQPTHKTASENIMSENSLDTRTPTRWKMTYRDKNSSKMDSCTSPIVVPDILKDCLLILAHDKSGHNGFRRTYGSH